MMLPHVDEFRPVHNLKSIEGLISALSASPEQGSPVDPRAPLRGPHHLNRR